MRVVVTGAAGLVGRAVVERFSVGQAIPPAGQAGLPVPHQPGLIAAYSVIGLTHADLDITDRAAVAKTILDLDPDLIINCVAISVDECERDPALARAVNVDGPAVLAEHAPAILHLSSNYVFEGNGERFYTPADEAKPINVYGRTKLEGERAVMARCPRAFVIRSSWIFGPGKESFFGSVHTRLRAGERVPAVDDVWASTTYVGDLVARLLEIVNSREFGIHHVVNDGVCSRESFAREAALIVRASEALIEPVSAGEVHAAPRPRYTPLRAMPPLRHWRSALRAYIDSSA